MPTIKVDVYGLCPFRSPVEVAEERKIDLPSNEIEKPREALGPCLYAACGFWKVTRVEKGNAVDGMCGVRFIGEVLGGIALSLEQLVKIQSKQEIPVGHGSQKGS